MNRKLHVTNLSPTTSPRELRELFSEAGHVAAITVIRDGIAGRENRMAYVDMQSHDGAQAAMARFNEYRLQGSTLNVSASRPGADESADRPASPLLAVPPRARERGIGDGAPRRSNDMLDEGGPLRRGD